ncbi:MAG: hypothetical protein EXR87_06790 [Gammaproteobacteria bacterium]|nr:hypothetical protein [Gammaproteobacteria bacterium]
MFARQDDEDAGPGPATNFDAVKLLRTVQQHHAHLNSLADQKANTMVGACFVVLAILIGQMKVAGFSLPWLILTGTTLMAALCSVLAVMPRGINDRINPAAINFNLLFFGHFSNLSADEFRLRMEELISADASIHRAMIMDIYWMGKLLHGKKYRYLMYSYRIFLAGLALTMIGTIYAFAEGMAPF